MTNQGSAALIRATFYCRGCNILAGDCSLITLSRAKAKATSPHTGKKEKEINAVCLVVVATGETETSPAERERRKEYHIILVPPRFKSERSVLGNVAVPAQKVRSQTCESNYGITRRDMIAPLVMSMWLITATNYAPEAVSISAMLMFCEVSTLRHL